MFQNKGAQGKRKEKGYLWWFMSVKNNYKQFDVEWNDSLTGMQLQSPRLLQGCVSLPPCIFNEGTLGKIIMKNGRCPICKGTVSSVIDDLVVSDITERLWIEPQQSASCLVVRFRDGKWAKLEAQMVYQRFEWSMIVEAVGSCSLLEQQISKTVQDHEKRVGRIEFGGLESYFVMHDGRVCMGSYDSLPQFVSFRSESGTIEKWGRVAIQKDLLVGYFGGTLYLCEMRYYKTSESRCFSLTKLLSCELPFHLVLSEGNLLFISKQRQILYRNIVYGLEDVLYYKLAVPEEAVVLPGKRSLPVIVWMAHNSIIISSEGNEFQIELDSRPTSRSYGMCLTSSNRLLMLSQQSALPSLRFDIEHKNASKLRQTISNIQSELKHQDGICQYIDGSGKLRELIILE